MSVVTPKVTLLCHTPAPEMTVAAAARLCYSPADIDTVREGMDEERAAGFVRMLAEMGHESPIEHASFTFGIEGVSRSLLAQITRHRIASFSVQSQRYVVEDDFDYVLPPSIQEDEEAAELFRGTMEQLQMVYDTLLTTLSAKHEQEMIDGGMEPEKARAAAKRRAAEDARFVLPNACDTKMIVTMNARSLYNFFALRCCSRAQWEIREVACQMLALVREAAPSLFEKAGPPCVAAGRCPEGKMSCGKFAEVRARFAAMGEDK